MTYFPAAKPMVALAPSWSQPVNPGSNQDIRAGRISKYFGLITHLDASPGSMSLGTSCSTGRTVLPLMSPNRDYFTLLGEMQACFHEKHSDHLAGGRSQLPRPGIWLAMLHESGKGSQEEEDLHLLQGGRNGGKGKEVGREVQSGKLGVSRKLPFGRLCSPTKKQANFCKVYKSLKHLFGF